MLIVPILMVTPSFAARNKASSEMFNMYWRSVLSPPDSQSLMSLIGRLSSVIMRSNSSLIDWMSSSTSRAVEMPLQRSGLLVAGST